MEQFFDDHSLLTLSKLRNGEQVTFSVITDDKNSDVESELKSIVKDFSTAHHVTLAMGKVYCGVDEGMIVARASVITVRH